MYEEPPKKPKPKPTKPLTKSPHEEMIALLKAGTATPEQQLEIAKHLTNLANEILLLREVASGYTVKHKRYIL